MDRVLWESRRIVEGALSHDGSWIPRPFRMSGYVVCRRLFDLRRGFPPWKWSAEERKLSHTCPPSASNTFPSLFFSSRTMAPFVLPWSPLPRHLRCYSGVG
jgi:hypothetical protein